MSLTMRHRLSHCYDNSLWKRAYDGFHRIYSFSREEQNLLETPRLLEEHHEPEALDWKPSSYEPFGAGYYAPNDHHESTDHHESIDEKLPSLLEQIVNHIVDLLIVIGARDNR